MMQDEIIRYEGVGMTYNSKKVLSGFNLSIKRGQKILLKGKSGAGKSTLFKMLLGFEKPTDGALYYRNQPVDPSHVWEIRKEVAYVSQETDLGEGPVKVLFEEIFSYHPNRDKMDPEKLQVLMQDFELEEDTLDKNYEDLSGGEKQRIGILIALMLGREIFLLDEATSALDSELKKKVADYFLKHGEWTLFIISHDREWEREEVKVVELKKQAVEGKQITEGVI
ncbi:ABC transporter ATP-binding protein [Methanosarcina sp. Mfa9]|uniref:ABC transporter ATP-binding protein n=1 Tax=Methanosarcina sp. Mfa9 TaxID=3439063 RepID=UPI003F865B84